MRNVMEAHRLLPRRVVVVLMPFLVLAALTACATKRPVAGETTGSTAPASEDGAFNALAAGITPLTVEQERDEQKRERANRLKLASKPPRP